MALAERIRTAIDRRKQHDDADLRREVIRLAVPSVGEKVLMVLTGIVNTMLVGHLGASSLAAVGMASTFSMFAATFFSAVAVGATAMVAQATGARNPTKARRALEQAMLLAILMGAGATALILPCRHLGMRLMGADAESAALGATYMTYIGLGLTPFSVLLVGNAALRGAGDTRTPMVVMSTINMVNLAVAAALIRGIGPLAELGVQGAGIALFASQSLGCLMVVGSLRWGNGRLRLRRIVNPPNRDILTELVRISIPAGGESLLMRGAFFAYARSISSLGTVPYAAYLIAQRIESFSTMPAFGFSVAATTLSGQSLGAGNPERARRSVFRTVEMAVMFSLCCALLSATLPRFLMGLFTKDADVIAMGIMPLRIVAIAQPIMAIAFSLSGGLRGAGDTRSTMVVTGIGAWGVRVPIAILSVTLLNLGLPGVQASMMFDWFTRLCLYAWRFRPRAWNERMRSLATNYAN